MDSECLGCWWSSDAPQGIYVFLKCWYIFDGQKFYEIINPFCSGVCLINYYRTVINECKCLKILFALNLDQAQQSGSSNGWTPNKVHMMCLLSPKDENVL